MKNCRCEKDCAKKHKVADVEKCTPNYKHKTKKEYLAIP